MVRRWDAVAIGSLSRDRYWGEGEDRAVRPALRTCTLIQAGSFRLPVDPSPTDAEQVSAELDRRNGLTPSDIEVVFIPHAHGDHHAGLSHFPHAEWLVDDGDLAVWRRNCDPLGLNSLGTITGQVWDDLNADGRHGAQ